MPPPPQPIDPMLLAMMMMGDGKMGSILPFLLMSNQAPGQSNMMPIMMMMMDEDQNLGDVLPLLLMMQNPGQDMTLPLVMMMMNKEKKNNKGALP